MNKLNTLLLLIFILVFTGCQKNKKVKTSGEETLNSERVLDGTTYSIQGFSFSTGSVILYNPQQSTNPPDIFVLPISDAQGNVTGAYLDSPNILNSFSLIGTYGTASEALTAFNNYKTVNVSNYDPLAQPILINQVWVFKTNSDKFTKLLILDIKTYKIDIEPNAEVRFKWVYQPDGGNTFPE